MTTHDRPRMTGPFWRRAVARTLLVTFTTSFVACGDSSSEVQTTTTVPVVDVSTTTAPPATIPPPPPTAPPPTLPAEPPDQLSKQQLRDLVAPVALYPDVVLASLLPATTNPDQVHEAAQYVGQADVVDRIPDDRGWDGSVIGLLQFPDALRWLDENPAWTDQMGQAVTYQQGDVLDAIQDYRRAARGVGNLQSNQYQKVRAAPNEDILIEPARPDVVYVPSYDPVAATQPQPAPSPGINPWIAFGGGAVVGALGAWALYSIFDDDDDDHDHYGNGGYRGGRRIRGYDNYYYAGGRRRPRPVEWTPRQRAQRARVEGWQQPRRLRHVEATAPRARKQAALRPPATRPATKAAYPTELQRDQGKRGQRQERPPKQTVPKAQQQKANKGRRNGAQRQPGPKNKAKQNPQRQEQRSQRQVEPQQQQKQQGGQAKQREQEPGNDNKKKKQQQGGKGKKQGAKQGQGGNP